ncbi:MAG: tyrosine--tRNA ligase [Candidatus Eisenbacteria bacterium]|nr:tyrosine--tRNA ligase [Candidatus Eisenbacteria bacterium]
MSTNRLDQFLPDLEWRGLLHQVTSDDLRAKLAAEPVTAYIGFDPTAASLHIGSLLQVLGLVRLQRAGHKPIAVVGGGTGLIGDPSGKTAERQLLTREKLDFNVAGIRKQLEQYLDFDGPCAAKLVNNADWLCNIGFIDFLRDIGKHFSVNSLVARDSVKLRLEAREQGMSFTEFSYVLLQAYDFLELYDRHGCTLQVGGSDQWGNIVDGADLIRRMRGASAWGLTQPLVTKSDGSKFGKSEGGNVWIDADLTPPYVFYQYWLNASDDDVKKYLRYFTLMGREQIEALDAEVANNPSGRAAQKTLADEVTKLVHGEAGVAEAKRATAALFGDGDLRALSAQELERALAGVPSVEFPREKLGTPEASLASMLAVARLAPSKGQARTLITGGSLRVNGEKRDQPEQVLTGEDVLGGGLIVLRKGKTYGVVRIEG